MKLSDIMSAADLAIYAEVGLVLFLAAFLGVVIRVLWPGREDNYEKALMIPLSDEPVQPRERQALLLQTKRASQKGVARK
jgi:cbb3-type cytochrome oxidase subunit 3